MCDHHFSVSLFQYWLLCNIGGYSLIIDLTTVTLTLDIQEAPIGMGSLVLKKILILSRPIQDIDDSAFLGMMENSLTEFQFQFHFLIVFVHLWWLLCNIGGYCIILVVIAQYCGYCSTLVVIAQYWWLLHNMGGYCAILMVIV